MFKVVRSHPDLLIQMDLSLWILLLHLAMLPSLLVMTLQDEENLLLLHLERKNPFPLFHHSKIHLTNHIPVTRANLSVALVNLKEKQSG